MGQLKRLETLAPHPDHNHSRPLFITFNNQIKLPADYDGMMGSMMLSTIMAEAFSGAVANENNAPFVTDCALDLLDEYYKDRAKDKPQETKGRGQGTFALGEHKTICNQFNNEDEQRAQALKAYRRDEPLRKHIEKHLKSLDTMLSCLKRDTDFDMAYAI